VKAYKERNVQVKKDPNNEIIPNKLPTLKITQETENIPGRRPLSFSLIN
jgi:hypothetical protein